MFRNFSKLLYTFEIKVLGFNFCQTTLIINVERYYNYQNHCLIEIFKVLYQKTYINAENF